MHIDTGRISEVLRRKIVDTNRRRILISNFKDTEQELDLSEAPNCSGYGRIRHFRRHIAKDWPSDPLPIDPATNALGLPHSDAIRAQVFQNSGCNWRCWYCFVPNRLLSGSENNASWLTCEELLEQYRKESDRPKVIDLSGGQPDLTPEWVAWMMDALEVSGMAAQTYLWSDDNLSSDYFWRYLSEREIERIASFRNYGKVCCFKGFDSESFSFNTGAEPAHFDRQFELFRRQLDLGIDLYAYATFTTSIMKESQISAAMSKFVDRLQGISEYLPLRTIPLKIVQFTPMKGNISEIHYRAMRLQVQAVEAWNRELDRRFAAGLRDQPIHSIPLKCGL